MDPLLISLLELFIFFILFMFNLQLFKSIRFDLLFRKGHEREVQLVYIFTVIIFTYLLTRALMNLIELTYRLV